MKIFHGSPIEKPAKKMPQLAFRRRALLCVDEYGIEIAVLVDYFYKDGYKPEAAKFKIENKGYSTEWAQWHTNGSFSHLIESVEE